MVVEVRVGAMCGNGLVGSELISRSACALEWD